MRKLQNKLEFIRLQAQDAKSSLTVLNPKAQDALQNILEVLDELEGYAHCLQDVFEDMKINQ